MANLGEIFVNCPEQFKRYDQNSSLIYFSNHSWSIRSWGRFLANKDGYIEFYVKNAEQLRDSFRWMDSETFDECIKNTVDIAEKCHLTLELGKSPLPDYKVPANHTIESYL